MTITSEMLVLLAVFLGIIIIFFYLQNRRLYAFIQEKKENSLALLPQWLAEMRAGIDRNAEMVNRQLANANEAINRRLDSTAQLLQLLNKDLGQVHQIGQQMTDFTHFFRSPRIRGKLGEQIMEDILHQVLPRSVVSIQHRFQNGLKVDALIRLDSGSIPIDAKFPLDNYLKAINAPNDELGLSFKKEFKRDVKKHIETIAGKYIVPAEGTLEFAVMYIPSETLYQEIILDDYLLKEAEQRNVLCVSPNSFYYFLRLILAGLYSRKIEKTAAIFMQHVSAFKQSVQELANEASTLATHLHHSKNAHDRMVNTINEMERKLGSLLYLDGED